MASYLITTMALAAIILRCDPCKYRPPFCDAPYFSSLTFKLSGQTIDEMVRFCVLVSVHKCNHDEAEHVTCGVDVGQEVATPFNFSVTF